MDSDSSLENAGLPDDRRRAKLTVAILLLVVAGLAAHWYLGPFTPSLSHPDMPANDVHEMTIIPAPDASSAGAAAQPSAENSPNAEALPPVEAELGPDIVELEEGGAP